MAPYNHLRVYGTRRNGRYYMYTSWGGACAFFLFGFHWLSHRKFYYFAQMSNCLIIYYILELFKKENLLYSRNWSTWNFLFWKFTSCCIFFSHFTAWVHAHWFEWKRVVSDRRWNPNASCDHIMNVTRLWIWSHAALLNITVLGSNLN